MSDELTKTQTYSINPCELNLDWTGIQNVYTFNGSAITITKPSISTELFGDDVVDISVPTGARNANANPSGTLLTDASNHTVTAALTGNDASNYKISNSTKSFDYIIKQVGITVTWDKNIFEYAGQSAIFSPEISSSTGIISGTDCQVVRNSQGKTNANAVGKAPNLNSQFILDNKSVYVATAQLSGDDSSNYVITTGATYNFIITRYIITITWGNNILEYNGENQAPSITHTSFITGDTVNVLCQNNYKDANADMSGQLLSGKSNYVAVAYLSDDTNYELSNVDTQYVIKQYGLNITWKSNMVYNGEEQVPFTITNPISGITDDYKIKYNITSIKQAKKYENVTVTVENSNYVLLGNTTNTFVIDFLYVKLTNTVYNQNYTASLTWSAVNTTLTNSMLSLTNSKTNETITSTTISSKIKILGMHNGLYQYGGLTGYETAPSTYLVGSTYRVFVSIPDENIKLEGNNYFVYNYKTVKIVGDSNYYTIEEAIAKNGNMILVGNETNYILTSFSLVLNTKTYNLYSRTLTVPYNAEGKDITREYNNELTGVYSALMIPSGITLNVNQNSNIVVSAIIDQCGTVERHGVLWNDGNMEFNGGSKLKSFGFTKGSGSIVMNSGTEAIDVFYIADWPGADEAVDLKNANAFPVQKWSAHNISCETKYYKDAVCVAYTYVVVVSGAGKLEINDIYIIGSSSTSKCLFKPNGGDSTDYIIKTATIPNDSITKTNQDVTQMDSAYINGKYIDSTVQVNVKYLFFDYSFATSTSIAVPIDYYDITVGQNSTLELVNSSYVFMSTNSSLTVEETGTLFVNGSAYLAMLNGSILTNNGKLQGSGTFGGIVETSVTGSSITISNYGCNSIVLKNGSTTTTTTSQQATGMIGNSAVYDDNGELTTPESYNTGTFTNGNVYISKKSSTNTYFYEGSSNYYKFIVNYNTNNGSPLASTTIYSFDSSYTISKDDLPSATKDFYDFDYWYYLDGNNNQVKLIDYTLSTSSTETPATITLYAAYTVHEYHFIYTGGYKIDGILTDITEDMILATDSFETFTIADFVDGKLTLPSASSYSYNNVAKVFNGWYVGVVGNSTTTAMTYITEDNLKAFIDEYGSSTIPLCCTFINAPVKVTIKDERNTILNGNSNSLEFNIESGTSLNDNDILFTVNSGSFDGDITYQYYFGEFTITGTDTYTLEQVLEMSCNSDTTFKVKWESKVAVSFNITGSITKFTYNSTSYNANTTYYFRFGDSFKVSGTYTAWGKRTPSISGLTASISKNSGLGIYEFDGTYTVNSNITSASITCSF